MSDIDDLYQQMILDHSKRPRHFGVMEDANRKLEGYNPLCGDKITIYMHVDNSHVGRISFTGTACAICTASASLMTEVLDDVDVSSAHELFDRVQQMLTGPAGDELPDEELGKLIVLQGVRKYPMRVKCATLPWHTMKAAMDEADRVVSTE